MDINLKHCLKVSIASFFLFSSFAHAQVKPKKATPDSLSGTTEVEEVVMVAFGKQKKESVVGSQSSIKTEELKTPTRDLTTAIAGKLAGVIATQRSGGPGQDGADLFIRGIATFSGSPAGPLLVVDGVPDRAINNIDPEDVESFTILKDATATAVYGTRGANGVILIKTKSGRKGKPQINIEMNSAVTAFTALPKFVDGPTFMRLFNEGQEMRGLSPKYTEDDIQKVASGVDPDLYPNVDWYKTLFNDVGSTMRMNMNVSGGAEKATYYLSAGYFGETGLFKSENIEAFNSKLKSDRFNYITNLKVNLTDKTVIDFGINGYITNLNYPAAGINNIFNLATSAPPHVIPARYSNGVWPQLKGALASPYMALTQSGVTNSNQSVINSNLRLTQELDSILKGLSVTGMFAFDVNSINNISRSRTLPTYYITERDADGNLVTPLTPTEVGAPNLTFGISRFGSRRFYMETALNYKRDFGNHDVSGLLLFNQSDFRDATSRVSTYVGSIPYRQRNVVGRVNYGYDGKYHLEANFSYSGSDNFIKEKRYGFFPSFGAGWVVSKESFFEPVRKVMNFFKLRYSYGLSGNANQTHPDSRFLYLDRLAANSATYDYTFGVPGATRAIRGFYESKMGGLVHWETSYRHNLGIEMNFLRNDLKFIVELFKERREGILLQDFTIPYMSGFTIANIPHNNVGITKNKGVDVTVDYNKSFAKGSFIAFRGTFNYNKNENVFDGLPLWRYPWLDRIGRTIGQRFGLIAEGLFQTEEEVANSAFQSGDVRVGDIKYKDLNGDGIINSLDQTAIGYGSIPRILYGLTLGGGHKNFDISLFFQGAALVDFNYSGGMGTTPFSQGPTYGNMYTFVLDRWTPDNPNPNAFYPRLSTNEKVTSNYEASTWWIKRSDYLRLKQAEIGYTINGRDNGIGINKLRIYFNGTNLLTFSKWKFWDPELGDGRGASYPNIKTYNLGFRITF